MKISLEKQVAKNHLGVEADSISKPIKVPINVYDTALTFRNSDQMKY